MKKVLLVSVLLVCMLAATGAVAAELPRTGDQIHGFTVRETREFPLIDATIVRLEHDRTGAEVFYIANDDVNRVFDLVFRTTAVDNTGLPHVFEHATLSGSEKYPSTALFFNLSFQTYNSYMNASTYDIMTSYPVASYSEAQLLKLADFYTDSCLHPMVMENEDIFRTEAWRYRLNSPEDDLTLEGTVYSEMLGANTLARSANQDAYRTAFPGSTIGNNQGGDNDAIPNMTWDMVKSFHDTYYHPSNCVAYLYGDIEDWGAFLALLDDAFAPYERRETAFDDPDYTPITAPAEDTFAFAMESGANTSHISVATYIIVCPDVAASDLVDFDMAVDLMSSDTSALMISLQEAIPYGTFSCGTDFATPENCVIFTASNIDPEDAETFRAIVDEKLAEIAQTGFTDEQIDSELAGLAIDVRLIRESSDVGYSSVIPSFAYYYMGTGNPWFYADYISELDTMADRNADGTYAALIGANLVNNPRNALTVTYPEAGLKEQRDAELAAHLAEIKAGMTEEEIAAIVEASNTVPEDTADTAAMVTALTAVTTDTLPEESKTYEIKDYTDDSGLRHIEAVAGVDGIGQADIFLDASGIAAEDLHWFRLMTHLVGKLGSTGHSLAELTMLSSRYMYNGSLRSSLLNEADGSTHLFFRLSWIAADDDLQAGYDLAYELAFQLDYSDTEKLLKAVQAVKSAVRSNLNEGYTPLLYRQFARTSELDKVYVYMNYIEYYDFLNRVEAQLQDDPAPVAAELERVREQLRNGTGAIAVFSGSEKSAAVNEALADAFIARLNSEPITRVSYDSIPMPAASEGLVIDSKANFNVLSAAFEELGLEGHTGDLDAVTALVGDKFLIPLLRDQYGAYSVFHGGMDRDGMYIITYRDPNVAESFAVMEQLPELVAGIAADLDQETLDGYILSSYTYYATPEGELTGAVNAAINYYEGRDPDEKVEAMQALKALTPESVASFADVYARMMEHGCRGTAGGASTLEANAALYDVILNPLDVAGQEETAITDIPEEHEYAEAIAALLDADAMTAEGGLFRPDDPATVADMAYAFHVLGTGSKTADGAEAYNTLVGYDLLIEGADPTAELDWETLNAQLQYFLLKGYNFPFDETMEGGGDIATRGELAGVLYYIFLEP